MTILTIIKRLQSKMEGLLYAANRYPLTMIFLVMATLMSAIAISANNEGYIKYLLTFIVGALLSAVAQQLYERFFTRVNERMMLMAGAVVVTVAYYFTINSAQLFSTEMEIKTGIVMFALLMAFIWVPSIKSKLTFNESFMATFKAFFITVLFTIVIAGGISLILFSVDSLLFSVGDKTIVHALNIVFCLFAPIFFLSFAPLYFGKKDESDDGESIALRDEKIEKSISCPNNLKVLISYIIIPLTAVYTLILLAYVLFNVGGDFWTRNLLEPLLVSYSITVIVVYILSSHLDNKFAHFFRKVFPKVLVPIVLFQTIASILKISEMGVTYGRYYAILFGVFAIIAGLVFSFMPVRRNGMIVAVLLVFSAISIMPPVDAFTVSRVNQINLLEKTLVKNNMLADGMIVPNAEVSDKDKKVITSTVNYLDRMDEVKNVDWLPNNLYGASSFQSMFGFDQVYEDNYDGMSEGKYVYLDWERDQVLDVAGYDQMAHLFIGNAKFETSEAQIDLEKEGISYRLVNKLEDDFHVIRLLDENDAELLFFNTAEIFESLLGKSYDGGMTVAEATITAENDRAKIGVVTLSADRYGEQYNAEMYVFVKIK